MRPTEEIMQNNPEHKDNQPARKILLVGKKGILSWVNDLRDATQQAGHQVSLCYTNPLSLTEKAEKRLRHIKELNSPALLNRLCRQIQEVQPELILFMGAGIHGVALPESARARITRETGEKTILAGWACDCFRKTLPTSSAPFDHLFYFDSAMTESLRNLYAEQQIGHLPLAVNLARYFPIPSAKKSRAVFAGSCRTNRKMDLQKMEAAGLPLDKYGSGLGLFSKRIHPSKINAIYNCYQAVLNINQIPNTINGLNLRCFEATAAGSLLITQNCADLSVCFTPGSEVLTYHNAEEAAAFFHQAVLDPDWAEQVATAGRRKTLNEHTYRHRMQTILHTLFGAGQSRRLAHSDTLG